MKCPVCHNESTNNICPTCGYSLVSDLLNNRFLNKLSEKEIEEYNQQISIHRKLYLKTLVKTKDMLLCQNVKRHYTQDEKKKAQFYFDRGTNYYGKKDYSRARECFEISGENGKGLAYFYLGIIYRYGKGVNKDYYKAFEYYNKSANLGTDIALKYVADMYLAGEGVEANLEKGMQVYEKALQSTDHWALYELGRKYYAGLGVLKQDYVKARECFEKDINSGDGVVSSYYMLAEIYEKGLGVSKDISLAKKYRNKYDELLNRNK